MGTNSWNTMKKEFREAMEASGRWPAVVQEREKLKISGMAERAAWEQVMKKYWLAPATAEAPTVVVGQPDKADSPDIPDWMANGVDSDAILVKDAAVREIIEWVAANIIIQNVDVAHAPGPKALGLLRWVKLSPMNESDFWKTIYPKVMPTKKELNDEQERISDDGDDLADLCDELAEIASGV